MSKPNKNTIKRWRPLAFELRPPAAGMTRPRFCILWGLGVTTGEEGLEVTAPTPGVLLAHGGPTEGWCFGLRAKLWGLDLDGHATIRQFSTGGIGPGPRMPGSENLAYMELEPIA